MKNERMQCPNGNTWLYPKVNAFLIYVLNEEDSKI